MRSASMPDLMRSVCHVLGEKGRTSLELLWERTSLEETFPAHNNIVSTTNEYIIDHRHPREAEVSTIFCLFSCGLSYHTITDDAATQR